MKHIFIKSLTNSYNWTNAHSYPEDYSNVVLVCLNYADKGLDLMLAYDDDSSLGCIYLGNWNINDIKQ